MFVKPAKPHLVVRDPRSRVRLPVEGRRVPDTNFWRRRLACGDVVEIDPPANASPAKAPKSSAAPKDSKE